MVVDTRTINARLRAFEQAPELWLFGYGSLIYKAGFPYRQRRPALVRGWVRRFWQGSHDHRGTAQAPGRVTTLVRQADGHCLGMAYRIEPGLLAELDAREKNGYLRTALDLHWPEAAAPEAAQPALTYVAPEGNGAWLGPADEAVIARQIARAHGPSGSNRDYLLGLAAALRELGDDDPHVFAIERYLLDEAAPAPAAISAETVTSS